MNFGAIKMNRHAFLAFAQAIILIGMLHPFTAMAAEDVSDLFCTDMQNPDVYDDRNFESYKMLIPGKDGWIFRTETDLKSDFSLTRDALDNLRDLNQVLNSRGIDLVMLIAPTRGLVHGENLRPEDMEKYNFTNIDKAWDSYRSSLESIKKEGIAVVGIPRPEQGTSFFYKRDHHWNADGAKFSAEVLAAYIKNLPAYKKVEKQAFVTKDGEDMELPGVSKKVFKKIGNTNQAPEASVKKITELAEASGESDALFGDAKIPDIVLMGTSNSTQEPSFANFEGFLKEALSADVLNMSVSGGGLDTAMLAYFNSDYYKKNPAKIAIWEIPSYYDISNNAKFFREAIPAAYGGCRNMVAEQNGVELDDKSVIVLSKLAKKKIWGANHYLYLNFSEPVAKPFNANFLYTKSRDKYRFAHSTRYPSDREFYYRLDNQKDSPLDKIVLNVPKEFMGLRVDAKICEQQKLDVQPASFFIKR